MANKDKIKGLTVKIGADTSELSQALKKPNQEAASLQSKLNAVEQALKVDSSNIEILNQKFRLLEKSIGANQDKLDLLKKAQKEFVDSGKDIDSDEYIELQRLIATTTQKINKLKTSQDAVSVSLEKIGQGASEVNDVKNKVQALDNAMEDAEKSSNNLGDALKGAFLGAGIVEGIEGIYNAMSDTVDESKEYIKIMTSLETSSKAAGYTAEETTEAYNRLYGVLGDDQTTATTIANLQAIGLSQEYLIKMLDGAVGSWSRFGDSIPIDGLSESINESIRCAKITGNLADVINWCGESEDAFNEKLAKTTSDVERANLVLELFTKNGLIESADAWRENAKELVESNNATSTMQKATSKLSKTMLPFLSKMKNGTANALLGLSDLLDGSKEFDDFCDDIIDSFEDMLPDIVKKGKDIIDGLGEGIADAMPDLLENLLDVVQESGDFLLDQIPVFIDVGFNFLSNLVKGITDSLPVMIQKLPLIITTFSNVINQNFPKILAKGGELLLQLLSGILNAIPTLIENIPQIIQAIVSVITAYNWLNLGKTIITGLGNGIKNMVSWIREQAGNITTSLLNKFKSTSLYDVGSNLIKGLWNGINSVKDWILNKISGFTSSILNGIKGFFGIHSPSKVMADEVGKFLPAGIGEGITKNKELALSPLHKLQKEMSTSFNPDMTATINKSLTTYSTFVIETPVQLTLDGKVVYNNFIKRVTRANATQLTFQGG